MRMGLKLFLPIAAILVMSSASPGPTLSISVGPLNFGQFHGSGTFAAQSVLRVRAPAGAACEVTAGAGQNASGGSRNIQRLGGRELIPYELYKDSACTIPWGDSDTDGTFPGGSGLLFQGTGRNEVITIYARLVVGPRLPPGAYGDSLVVTVHF